MGWALLLYEPPCAFGLPSGGRAEIDSCWRGAEGQPPLATCETALMTCEPAAVISWRSPRVVVMSATERTKPCTTAGLSTALGSDLVVGAVPAGFLFGFD
jgi:hypothetical protein